MKRDALGRNPLSLVLFLTLLVLGPLGADEDTLPLDRLTFDEWYGIYMQGNKVGHAHLTTGAVDREGETVFETSMEIAIAAHIEGMKMNIAHRSQIHFEMQSPWRRLYSLEEVDMAGALTSYEEVFADGTYTVTTVSPSGTQRQVTERPSASLRDHFAIELACLRGVKKGHRGEALSWDVESFREEKKTYEFLRIEPRVTDGVVNSLGHVREIGEDGDASEILYEMKSGRVIQWSMGSLFTIRLEPRETALDRSRIQDYVLSSNHSVDRKFGFDDPSLVEECRLFLPGLLPSDVRTSPRTQVTERPDGVEILVRNEPFERDVEEESAAAHFLAESPGIQSRHEEVVALARTIVGDEASPRVRAERIVHWVYENLEKDRLFDTDALTVLRKRKGDCSEHAILAVALARAAGIPADKAGGLMYAGDRQGDFVAHAWVRFYLDGAWVEMDPTWDQLQVDATHISLTSTGVSKLAGQVIEVLDAKGASGLGLRRCPERACRKLAVADSWTHCSDCSTVLPELPAQERWSFSGEYTVVGRMYRNRALGFQIEKPGPTWSFISDPELVASHSDLVTVILHSPEQRYAMVRVEELAGSNLEEYAGRIQPQGTNPTKLGEERISLHGHDAIRLRWKTIIGGEEMHFSYAVLQDGDRFYQVIAWCSEKADPAAAAPAFDSIQKSFWLRGRAKG